MIEMMPIGKKMMLIGETGVGKSTLIKVCAGENITTHKSMAIEFCGQFINTPGEFLENRRFYSALITAAVDSDILAFFQDATRNTSLFPPKFATMFNKKIIGIVSKVDAKTANIERATRFLNNAGVKEIILLSSKDGTGLEQIKELLV